MGAADILEMDIDPPGRGVLQGLGGAGDIARAAGVAKGALYLYLDGKAAVFRAMHARTPIGADLTAAAVRPNRP